MTYVICIMYVCMCVPIFTAGAGGGAGRAVRLHAPSVCIVCVLYCMCLQSEQEGALDEMCSYMRRQYVLYCIVLYVFTAGEGGGAGRAVRLHAPSVCIVCVLYCMCLQPEQEGALDELCGYMRRQYVLYVYCIVLYVFTAGAGRDTGRAVRLHAPSVCIVCVLYCIVCVYSRSRKGHWTSCAATCAGSMYCIVLYVCLQPEQEGALDELCGYMRRQLARLRLEKYRPSDHDRPPLLYTFHTLHGLTVDLRLFNRSGGTLGWRGPT